MASDRIQLFKYGLMFAVLVIGWFALTMVSKNIVVQIVLGWIGLGVVALFYWWVSKHKLPPKHEG